MQATSHSERFKAEMPRIPGVNDNSRPPKPMNLPWRPLLMAAVFALVGGLGWWAVRAAHTRSHETAYEAPDGSESLPAVSNDLPVPEPKAATPARPTANAGMPVATVAELSKPWSSKQFMFVDPETHESVPAMILRLPVSDGSHSGAYWAFSLRAPFESCQLEYVSSVEDLAARYNFRSSHPMVAAPCDKTLYDPLRVGTAPSGAWVRGEIAQGPGIRPPLAVDVRVQGNSIIADRME